MVKFIANALLDIIPDAADITAEALEYIARKPWRWRASEADEDAQPCWLALLFDAEGDFLTGGSGRTALQAAAEAWLWTWHPMDDDWDGVMPESGPDDYRFELFPPGTWEPHSPDEWDQAWENEGLPASWVERRRVKFDAVLREVQDWIEKARRERLQ
jgi:hypothetical protein